MCLLSSFFFDCIEERFTSSCPLSFPFVFVVSVGRLHTSICSCPMVSSLKTRTAPWFPVGPKQIGAKRNKNKQDNQSKLTIEITHCSCFLEFYTYI